MNPLHLVRDALLPLGRRIGARPVTGDPATLLIVQPDHLGDILLSQPAVYALREGLPEHRLVAIVGPWSEQIARLAWPVDEVVAVEFPGFTRSNAGSAASPYLQIQQDAERLREIHARHAVILRPDAWWAAWLAWLSVPGHVVTADDPRASQFATVAASIDDGMHAAERAFTIATATLDAIGDRSPNRLANRPLERQHLTLPPNDDAAERARSLLAAHRVTGRYIVIHPGSGAPVKLWPASRWRTVISRWGDMHIVLTGGESERELCAALAERFDHVYDLSGETPLDTLIEILRGADIVAGPDSGPLHLAVAAGRPTVTLFGPSDSVRYGPWGPAERHRVVSAGWTCPRCGDLGLDREAGCGCMLAITPEAVERVMRELLRRDER